MDPRQTLQKRSRAKLLSRALATGLAELRSPLEKSYRNTVYCSECIAQEGGVMTTRYCGNRWCLVCSRVRTARAINAYMPVLGAWAAPYMVTLTVPNCDGPALESMIAAMLKGFTSCKRSMKRAGYVVRAVRKLECTYNPRREDYHPHFHVLVDGREVAEELRRLWLRYWKGAAVLDAQDVRPCDGNGGMLELFKYFTKLLTPGKGKRGVAPLLALDTIFRAMRGRRVWQPVGFTLSAEEEEAIEGERLEVTGTAAFKRSAERVLWDWCQDVADWIDRESGETLSEYEPTQGYRELVASIGALPPSVAVEAVNDG